MIDLAATTEECCRVNEEKRLFKKYTFYNHQFDEFTKALEALRVLGLKHSYYNQAPPDINDPSEQVTHRTPNGYTEIKPLREMRDYLGDWHIIEVYHD